MKKPILRKSLEIKKCHNFEWKDYYSWIHQENILEVLRDSTKLNSEVKKYLLEENKYTNFHLKNTVKTQKLLFKVFRNFYYDLFYCCKRRYSYSSMNRLL